MINHNKNKEFVYELTQEEFFNLSKPERMISHFKTSREILKKFNLGENDEKFKRNFVLEKKK